MKYFVYRKRGNIESLLVIGSCLEFISHYLKHNISEEEIQYCVVYEAKELDIKEVMEKNDLDK
jgi:hypothetical protein